MKLAAAVVMKDEADVLGWWLKAVEHQVDALLFLDNDSEDDSFRIASEHPKTIWAEQTDDPFRTALWGRMVEPAREAGADWLWIAAPDLLPFFDLRQTIIKATQRGAACIWTHYPVFFFTRQEHERYKADPHYCQQTDEASPFVERRWYRETGCYLPTLYRLTPGFRYTKEPMPARPDWKTDLDFGHYRFRSPEQMAARMEVRKLAQRKNGQAFRHYKGSWDWRDYLIDERLLHRRWRDEQCIHDKPKVRLWELVEQNRTLQRDGA